MFQRYRSILVLSILLAAMLAATAQAGYPVRESKPRVIQTAHVTASGRVQIWESKQLTVRQTLYVHIYRHGREVKQQTASGCTAGYRSQGLIVRMRVHGCTHRRWSIALRYVSLSGIQRFKVRITTSACDRAPGARGGCY